jgi:hypothetical protein
VIFEIGLLIPTARPGAAALTESLGPCSILSKSVFFTVTEHNGEAHAVPLSDVVEYDRAGNRITTSMGRTLYPRRVDLPSKIFVETNAGYARAVSGDQIARLVRARRDVPTGRVCW